MIYDIVTSLSDAPVGVNDTVNVLEDDSIVIHPLANDTDDDDLTLSDITIKKTPSLGKYLMDSISIIYTPYENMWGRDTMSYTVRDSQGFISNTTFIFITIDSVNEAPTLVDLHLQTDEDISDTTNVIDLSIDNDQSGLSLVMLDSAVYGKVSIANNSIVYTPDLNFVGLDTFAYYICDGELDTSKAHVFYRVIPENNAPVAYNDTITLTEDIATYLDVLSNDIDVEDTVLTSVVIVDYPTQGKISVDTLGLYYEPNSNVWGYDTLRYYTYDKYLVRSNTAEVYIVIDSVNEKPEVPNVSYSMYEDTRDTIDVMEHAFSPDFSQLSLVNVLDPLNGNVQIYNGSIIYQPNVDFYGEETIRFEVVDGDEDTVQAKLTIDVININDAPLAIADSCFLNIKATNSFVLDVLSNDTDTDSDALAIALVDSTTNGALMLSYDKQEIQYTTQYSTVGLDSLTYYLFDNLGAKSDTVKVILVLQENDVITYINDSIYLSEDSTVFFNPQLTKNTSLGDVISYKVYDEVVDKDTIFTTHGCVILVDEDNWSYCPETNDFGTDTLNYTLVLNSSEETEMSIFFDIAPVNDAPVNIQRPMIEGDRLGVNLITCRNDEWLDVDGDDLSTSYTWIYAFGEEQNKIISKGDSLLLSDELMNANIWCEITVNDGSISVMASSDTSYANVFNPKGLLLSTDSICRSWKADQQISSVACVGDGERGNVTYDLLSDTSRFHLNNDQLYLKTEALFFNEQFIDLDVRVNYAYGNLLSKDFTVTFSVINDLLPSMVEGYPEANALGETEVNLHMMADKPSTVYFELQDLGVEYPSFNLMDKSNSYSLDANTEFVAGLSDVNVEHAYQVAIYLEDAAGESISGPYVTTFQTKDITSPLFLSGTPYIKSCGVDSAVLVLQLNEKSKVSFNLWEDDETVLSDGEVRLDTTMVICDSLDAFDGNQIIEYPIESLSSQISYYLEVVAEDNYSNHTQILPLTFNTNDTIQPFFISNQTRIENILSSKMSYTLLSSEGATVRSRITLPWLPQVNFDHEDSLGIYSSSFEVEENELFSVETEQLLLDGNYRLDIALTDSAGNISSVEGIEFSYPVFIPINLLTPIVYLGEELMFSQLHYDGDYTIYNINGRLLRSGRIFHDHSACNIDNLNEGTYIIKISNELQQGTFQFVKAGVNRSGTN